MRSFADKLNRLFAVMHPAAEPEISNAAAAEGITRESGIPISPEELERLRAGSTHEVSAQQPAAIARFFGVSASYFTDPSIEPMVDAQLNLLEAARDRGIRDLHRCGRQPAAPKALTPQAINDLARIIRTRLSDLVRE